MNRIREAPRPVEKPAVSADVNAAASILSRVIGPPLPKQTLDQIDPPLTGQIPSKGEVPPKPLIRSEKNINGPRHISSEKMSRLVTQAEITAEKIKVVPESRKSTNNQDIAVVLISIEPEVPEESSARVPLDKEEMFVLLQNFSEVLQILEKLSVRSGTEHRPAQTARSDREEEIRQESPEEYYISPIQKGKNLSLVLWYIVQVMNCLNITDIIFT